jgi:hypothetical protein
MTCERGLIHSIDGELLDFLAYEISGQMLHEIVRGWTTLQMGHPTVMKLATIAETLHLQAAVLALDR